jgi:O-antigen/teichoic acid export membrane protein
VGGIAVRSITAARSSLTLSAGGVVRLGVGFLSWLVAARLFPEEQVGIAASTIAAMSLCVQIGILGVDLAFIKLYPLERARPRELIESAITLAVVASLLAGLACVALAATGFRALSVLSDPLYMVLFLLMVAFHSCWWMMDQISVAMQRTERVLTRGITDGVVTLFGVLVLGLTTSATAGAILGSWAAGALVVCLIGVPQLARATASGRLGPRVSPDDTRRLLRVGLPNFVLTAADNAPSLILPIVAAQVLSVTAAAYWYTVWMMGLAAYSIPMSFALNLFAEVSAAPAALARATARALRSGLVFGLAACIGLAAFGPFVLRILGPAYVENGTGPVRLVALATLPMVVTKVYLAVCRATGRMKEGTLAAFALGAGGICLGIVAAPRFGLSGIAAGWLAAQTIGAIGAGIRLQMLVREPTAPSPASSDDLPPTRRRTLPPALRPLTSQYVHAAIPLAALAAWAFAMRDVPLRDMNDLGLISVLPVSSLVPILVIAVSFCLSLRRRPIGTLVPLVHVLVLIVVLYGVTAFIEGQPRFESVYKHSGVMDYIVRHGTVDPDIDAYFNWPGFFAFGAVLTKVAGFSSPLSFGAWGPLGFNLLFLAPLLAIVRWVSDDRRLTWLAVWLFYSTNWVAQDYISPQALAYLLWLTILVVLLWWLTPRPEVVAARIGPPRGRRGVRLVRAARRRLMRFDQVFPTMLTRNRSAMVLLVVAMFAAIVTGHQLTPFAVILCVGALVLFSRLQARTLPLIMVVLTAVWLIYMTTAYLSGNIESLTSSLGSLGGNVNQNVGGRLGGSAEHLFIVQLRLLYTAALWGAAAVGVWRRRRAGYRDIALVVIGIAPFLLPVLQPYGGEMLLRVFLFALPSTTFFIAAAAFPSSTAGRGWVTTVAITLVSCLALGGFMYTRYGNERLDYFTSGDAAAVSYLYGTAPKGSMLVAGGSNLPWRQRDYERYDYRYVTDLGAWYAPCGTKPAVAAACDKSPDPDALAAGLLAQTARRGGYLIVTRSTEVQAELITGLPEPLPELVASLRRSPRAQEIYSRDGAVIFRLFPATR